MGLFNRKKTKAKVVKNSVESTISFNQLQLEMALYNETSYKKLSAVVKCKDLIGDSISKLPFFVYNKYTSEIIKDHYLNVLLELAPNKVNSKTQFFKTFMTQLLYTGNAYIYPVRDNLEVVELKILENVSIIKNDINGTIYYDAQINNKNVRLRPDEIIHLMINAEDGVTGVSVLTSAQQTLRTALSQEKFQEEFYERGGRPTGTLEVGTDLSNQLIVVGIDKEGKEIKMSAKDAMKDAWERHIKQGSGTAVLDNGMKYATVNQISPKDMDFVSSKNQSISDIARYFNVPLSKLGVGTSTYSSREQEAIEFVVGTILPYANQICETFSRALLTSKELKKGLRIGTNTDEEILSDVTSRANYHKAMVQIGAESPSEVRVSEQLGTAYELGNKFRIGPNFVVMGGSQDTGITTGIEDNPEVEDNEEI